MATRMRLPIREDFPLSGDQPLRSVQADFRGQSCATWRSPIRNRTSPSCATSTPWRACERPDRRRPERYPQQPASLHRPGRDRQARGTLGVRQRLSDPDGSGVRDYIHVVDLALGHLRGLEKLDAQPGIVTVNLGTGQGYSVWKWSRRLKMPAARGCHPDVERRPGDIAACYADPAQASPSCTGRPNEALTKCAPTPGAGNPGTPTVSKGKLIPL